MSTVPEQIRDAAAAGDYHRARMLFDRHATAMGERALAGNLDEAALREMFELIEWTRQTALAERSHCEARIQELRREVYVTRAYGRPRE